MSTLKQFVHHALDQLPGPVPPPPAPQTGPAPEPIPPVHAQGALTGAARAAKARAAGQLRGEEAYTQAEGKATDRGWVESDETVEHKLVSKEEFPQG